MRYGENEVSYETEEMSSLIIKDLHVCIGEKEIIRGLTLEVPKGEVLNTARIAGK